MKVRDILSIIIIIASIIGVIITTINDIHAKEICKCYEAQISQIETENILHSGILIQARVLKICR